MEFFTEQEIRSRLGIATTAIRFKESEKLGEQHLALLRSLGISKIEITGISGGWEAGNKKEARQIAQAAKNQGIQIVSVHGFSGKFSSAYDGGITDEERRRTVKNAILTGEGALEMGATILVYHFGTTDASEQSVHELLDYFKGTPLILGGENVGKAVSGLKESDNVADFVRFAAKINSKRFGVVLDLGHARDSDGINPFIKKGIAYQTVALCKPWLVHLHLHDDLKGEADPHYPPFDGEVQWREVFKALYDIQYKGVFMFEPEYDGYSSRHTNVLEKVGSFPQKLMGQIT